ncbi:cytoskeleton-associated protein 4 [Xyrauchen texanus]|uniref:cytoskeleton-associated protein 4 n=1 Tax=Xyrauchen texanus TaxID=154827 RepID=UPI0022420FFA|nr:cytoskeleton-associated protein 4 [Xyrauchen texanus]
MTAKNRNKNNSHPNDRSPAQQTDDGAKKPPKAESPRSGSSGLIKFISAVFYLALAAGAALASFYIHHTLSEVKQMSVRHEESSQKCAAVAHEVQHALLQISSVKASLEGVEAAVVSAKTDLERTSHAVQKGEAETQRMQETLQNLQNKIYHDLREGIQDVKEAREKDISSLERTLEERLAQLSRSITEGVAEFAGQQSQHKTELSELKARVEEQETPAFLKQELSSINSAVMNLNTANEVAEGNMAVLREQIASVGAELQTRNKEVVSVSEEIDTVRSLVQSTVGALREEVSMARASIQAASDQFQTLNDKQDQSSEALQSLEKELRAELLKVEKRGDDMEVRVKSAEDSEELLASSLSEQNIRVDALVFKYESHESLLTDYKTASEKDRQTLRDDLKGLKSSLEELQMSVLALDEIQVRLEVVEQRLEGPLHELESTTESLSEQLDGHEQE